MAATFYVDNLYGEEGGMRTLVHHCQSIKIFYINMQRLRRSFTFIRRTFNEQIHTFFRSFFRQSCCHFFSGGTPKWQLVCRRDSSFLFSRNSLPSYSENKNNCSTLLDNFFQCTKSISPTFYVCSSFCAKFLRHLNFSFFR